MLVIIKVDVKNETTAHGEGSGNALSRISLGIIPPLRNSFTKRSDTSERLKIDVIQVRCLEYISNNSNLIPETV